MAIHKLWVFSLSRKEGLGNFTAEPQSTPSKEFLIRKFSELCELCASVVNTSSQATRYNVNFAIRIDPIQLIDLANLAAPGNNPCLVRNSIMK